MDAYTEKADKMWESLVADDIIKPDETASVLTYYPGDRLFVMARAGLSQVLYDSNVLKPGDKIQKFLMMVQALLKSLQNFFLNMLVIEFSS